MGQRNEAQLGVKEGDFSYVDRARLIEALKSAVPPECLLVQQEDLRPYECDGLSIYRQVPMAVVLPRTEEQVVAVLKACHHLKAPVVAAQQQKSLPLRRPVAAAVAAAAAPWLEHSAPATPR